MKDNKKKLLIVGGISLALIAVIGITYAWLTQVLNGTKVNKITAGTLDLILDDEASNGIDLQFAVPQSDAQGLNNSAYTFEVKNRGSINAKYTIYLEDEELEDGEVRMSDSNIKFDLVKNSEESNPRLLSTVVSNNRRAIDSNVVINGGSTNTYSLRLWIDSEATQEEVGGKVFKGKINLEAVQAESDEQATIPTIDSCPGCVYAFTTDYLYYANNGEHTPTIMTKGQYEEDYRKVVKESGSNVFLGMKLNDTTKTIEKPYVCGIGNPGEENEKPICLEGDIDGSTYEANEAFVTNLMNNEGYYLTKSTEDGIPYFHGGNGIIGFYGDYANSGTRDYPLYQISDGHYRAVINEDQHLGVLFIGLDE